MWPVALFHLRSNSAASQENIRRFGGEVIVLALRVARRRGPVRRSEDRQPRAVQEDHFRVVDPLMGVEPHLHAGVVKDVDVVGVPQPLGIAVFL